MLILEKELQQEIQALQADMQVITNREVLGFATRRYIELKEQYFNLLATDLKLLKLYEKDNENLKKVKSILENTLKNEPSDEKEDKKTTKK